MEMQITEQMKERGRQKFGLLLADRVLFIVGKCHPNQVEGKLDEVKQIVLAAKHLGITQANLHLDETEAKKFRQSVMMLKSLELKQELFELLMAKLREIGVEPEYLDQIKFPEK